MLKCCLHVLKYAKTAISLPVSYSVAIKGNIISLKGYFYVLNCSQKRRGGITEILQIHKLMKKTVTS